MVKGIEENREWITEGNVWKVGDNINTESITPSRWLHEGHDLLMEHIGEMLIPDFPKKVKKGDMNEMGKGNRGCKGNP